MDSNSRRKRATIACTLCRKRKRRCDGASPSCQLCLDSGVACTYPIPEETVSKEDRLLEPIASRLDLLEENLRRQTTLLEALNDRGQHGGGDGPSMPTEHQTTSPLSCRLSAATSTPRPHERGSQTSQQAGSDPLHVDASTTPPPMTIPVGHCTTTASLLSLDVVKAILGEFPDDVFVRTEERRRMPSEMRLHGPPISIEDLPSLDPLQAEGLVESYFDHSHGEAPILDRVEIFELHHRLQQTCLGLDVESALYLSVLALGCAFGSHAAPRIHGSSPAPGVMYFVPALRILVPEYLESYGSSVMLSQGLLLAARYFAFFLCPLQSWKLVHMASTDIQHQFSRPDREYGSGEVGSETSMIVWAIFDMECNLIAEHQFPHSGIEHIVDRMELPGSQAGGDHESHTMLNWLAELAVRRLLNRVHHTMYGRDAMKRFAPKLLSTGSRSMAAVLNLSSELNQQLDVWFQTLPPIIRPNLANTEGRGPLELHLLHRYHSAKDIIFRPFVFFVYSAPEHTELPDLVLERAGTCLRHCRSYLAVAERILPLPSTSREIIMHSVLSATIMLTLGALSPPLTPLVEDIRDMQDTAISCLSPFAYPGSSVETMCWILQTLATKTHVLRNTSRKRVRRSSVSS